MKTGLRNFCNGATSTSTLNLQRKREERLIMHRLDEEPSCKFPPPSASFSSYMDSSAASSATALFRDRPPAPPAEVTLEEMLARLAMEEEKESAARQTNNVRRWGRVARCPVAVDDCGVIRRMSCVNNTDILRSARNALDQYPRFSLDGRDALYRSSFTNHLMPNKLVKQTLLSSEIRNNGPKRFHGLEMEEMSCCCGLPTTVGVQRVAWGRPGIVAKLMGLEFIPVPLMGPTPPHGLRLKEVSKKEPLRKKGRFAERSSAHYRESCNGKMIRTTTAGRSGSGSSQMNQSWPSETAKMTQYRKDWRMRRQ